MVNNMDEFEKTHKKALRNMESIISSLKNDRWYYDADFEYEYTPFEQDIKTHCESYCEFYIINNEAGLFFDSLTRIADAMVACEADKYGEDFFRPAELITYYFGKIITGDNDLKDPVHDWMVEFCHENEESMIVEDYFRPFIKGEKIYHADSYYTGYDDLNRMMRVFK